MEANTRRRANIRSHGARTAVSSMCASVRKELRNEVSEEAESKFTGGGRAACTPSLQRLSLGSLYNTF
jgi:hypothetical protein